MFFRFCFLGLICVFLGGCFSRKAHDPVSPDRYAYAAHSQYDSGKESIFLSQIDLETNKIIKEIPLKYRYAYLNLQEDGSLLLGFGNDGFALQRIVDRYFPGKNKVEKFIRTKTYSPSLIFKIKQDYYVLLGANSSAPLVLEQYSPNAKFIKSYELNPSAMCTYGSELFDLNKKKLLLFSNIFQANGINEFPSLINFDLEKNQLNRVDPGFRKYFIGINAVAYFPEIKQFYICSNVNAHPESDLERENKNLYVYSYPSFSLIKTIAIPDQAKDILRVGINKLYVSTGLKVFVVDCEKGKVIKELPFQPFRMEYVGNHKVLISHEQQIFADDPKTGINTTVKVIQKLVMIDTRTDTMIKEFPGGYGPISRRVFARGNTL